MHRITPHTALVAVGGRRNGPLRIAVALATAAVVSTAAAACGGDGGGGTRPIPAAAAFAPGVCQSLAPGLMDTMRITRGNHDGPEGLRALATDLVPPQEGLWDQIATAGEHAADVERVTTAIGWLRLRVAAGTYEPALLTEVTTATDTLVDRCT